MKIKWYRGVLTADWECVSQSISYYIPQQHCCCRLACCHNTTHHSASLLLVLITDIEFCCCYCVECLSVDSNIELHLPYIILFRSEMSLLLSGFKKLVMLTNDDFWRMHMGLDSGYADDSTTVLTDCHEVVQFNCDLVLGYHATLILHNDINWQTCTNGVSHRQQKQQLQKVTIDNGRQNTLTHSQMVTPWHILNS